MLRVVPTPTPFPVDPYLENPAVLGGHSLCTNPGPGFAWKMRR